MLMDKEQMDQAIGPNIIIQSLDGTTWLYGDLSPFSGISTGDFIRQGQYIAQEGNPAGTGSTGLHVHVELEMLNYGDSFRYGYANSSNPCTPLGLPNQIGGPYIYDGSPIIKKKKNKWRTISI